MSSAPRGRPRRRGRWPTWWRPRRRGRRPSRGSGGGRTRSGRGGSEPRGRTGTIAHTLAGSYLDDWSRATGDDRDAVVEAHLGRIDAMKSRLLGLAEGTRDDAGRRFRDVLASRPAEEFDRIAAWFPDDLLVLSFRPPEGRGKGTRGSWRAIDQGSPGQRSAALLSFLLSYGDEPLVLDQPEDDLDNKLISELVVRQMRERKTDRQIIVATHNANIVVNGDAELVVALAVVGGQTRQEVGGLQEQAVRDRICDLLEGGAEAFRDRYRRIAGGRDDA